MCKISVLFQITAIHQLTLIKYYCTVHAFNHREGYNLTWLFRKVFLNSLMLLPTVLYEEKSEAKQIFNIIVMNNYYFFYFFRSFSDILMINGSKITKATLVSYRGISSS
jgi:hypothetical protein